MRLLAWLHARSLPPPRNWSYIHTSTWHRCLEYKHQVGFFRSSANKRVTIPLTLPFTWEHSIHDSFDIIWSPLPLGFRVQFYKDDVHRIGFTSQTDVNYTFSGGVGFIPRGGFEYRITINHNWAIDITTEAAYGIELKNDDQDWSADIGAGFVFHINAHNVIMPRFTFGITNGYTLWTIDEAIRIDDRTQFVLIPSFRYQLSISRQWDFSAKYSYAAVGYTSDFEAHQLEVNFRHLW